MVFKNDTFLGGDVANSIWLCVIKNKNLQLIVIATHFSSHRFTMIWKRYFKKGLTIKVNGKSLFLLKCSALKNLEDAQSGQIGISRGL